MTTSNTDLSSRENKLNFILGSIQTGLWGLASTFSSINTVVPMFLKKLGASDVEIGLVPALTNFGLTLPSILSVPIVERTKSLKKFIIIVTWIERLPYLFLAILAFTLADYNPLLTIYLSLIFLGVGYFAKGFINPAWMNFVAGIIPAANRGRFTALGNGLGGVLGIIGSMMAGKILNSYPFPTNFGLCFTLTIFILIIGYIVLLFIKEPPNEDDKRGEKINYPHEIIKILRSDRCFRNYILVRFIISFGSMSLVFYTVYAVGRFSLADEYIGIFTMFLVGSQPLANLIWGPLADKTGHKNVLLGGIFCNLLGNFIAIITPSVYPFYLVFALSGAMNSASAVSGSLIILEFASSDRIPIYIGINNMFMFPALTLSPLIGGVIAENFGYHYVFLVSLIVNITGLAMLYLGVIDPRERVTS